MRQFEERSTPASLCLPHTVFVLAVLVLLPLVLAIQRQIRKQRARAVLETDALRFALRLPGPPSAPSAHTLRPRVRSGARTRSEAPSAQGMARV